MTKFITDWQEFIEVLESLPVSAKETNNMFNQPLTDNRISGILGEFAAFLEENKAQEPYFATTENGEFKVIKERADLKTAEDILKVEEGFHSLLFFISKDFGKDTKFGLQIVDNFYYVFTFEGRDEAFILNKEPKYVKELRKEKEELRLERLLFGA